MDIISLVETNPKDHNPLYKAFLAEHLPLDLPVPETDDMTSARLLVKWHYRHNISRALCIVLHRRGYREILSYDRDYAVTLDLVANGQQPPVLALKPVIDREWVAETDEGLILTPSGRRLWQMLPPALRSPETPFDGDANGYVRAELAKLPAHIAAVLAAKIEPCPYTWTVCPTCGGTTIRRKSAGSPGYFWKCQGECGAFFPDDDGKLVRPAECPECGKMSLHRYTSHQRPGVAYWGCRCGAFFADEHGFPGQPFADEEKAPCPTCDGQAARRVYIDGPHEGDWYWHCDQCGDRRDVDGQIGARYDEAIQ